MNPEQLAKSLGKLYRLRPQVIRYSEQGTLLESVDDQWILEEVKKTHIILRNPNTDHRLTLGNDNLREFRTPDYLLTRCNIILAGNEVKIEPLVVSSQATDAQMEIYYEKVKITQLRHDYRLFIAITNKGIKPINKYHVDLEFPAILLNKHIHHALQVRDRTTISRSFFRVTDEDHMGKPIYPGDRKIAMSVDYFVDSEIYDIEDKLFQELAKATLYIEGTNPIVVEKKISDLQIF